MSMDVWWEVDDADGCIREFPTLEEALEFAERQAEEKGAGWVQVGPRRKCGVGEEAL